jgi:2-polyprenyl-6-methoxyphenol hydroxylase-like FAD-dependent oxidoreductase
MNYYKSTGTFKADMEFEMASYTEPTPASPFLSSMLLTQPKLGKILHAALARKGCVVEKGIELRSFEQFPDYVNVKLVKRRGEKLVQEEERYKWMVGADGATLAMCRHLGLQFFGDNTRTIPSTIGDIRIDGMPPNSWHLWGNPPRENVSLRASEDPGVFTFHISGGSINHAQLCGNDGLLRKFFLDSSGAKVKFRDVLWSAMYKANAGMLDKFLVGRVLLTGGKSILA